MQPVPQRQKFAWIGGRGTAVAESWISWDGVDLGKGCRVQNLGRGTVLLEVGSFTCSGLYSLSLFGRSLLELCRRI